MRGDRPRVSYGEDYITVFTPHARGSTWPLYRCAPSAQVYPACAGIDPYLGKCPWPGLGLPRMRGDRPLTGHLDLSGEKFTPHARGSTLHVSGGILQDEVYPACAGIDLRFGPVRILGFGLPRMRGDRPFLHYRQEGRQ